MSASQSIRRDGFTLVELLVALTIISVLLLPLVSLVSMQLRNDQRSADRTVALIVADNTMERLLEPGRYGDLPQDDSSTVEMNNARWRIYVTAEAASGQPAAASRGQPVVVEVKVCRSNDHVILATLKALRGP